MVKYIGRTNNYLLKLIKKQRHKNVSKYTVQISLAKSEQVFLCCNQLNSFNGMDLSWALRIGRKGKKGQNIWKSEQKCTKFENILKKGW